MGRADEAVRHLIEAVDDPALPVAQFGRALAGDVTEDATEGAEALPPGLEGDVDHGQVCVAQQRLRALDPAGQQVAVRRQAERRVLSV